MKTLITILFTFVMMSNTITMHDAVTATFNVVDKGHVLLLEIDFDLHDYAKFNTVHNNQVSKTSFSNYLNKTTSWSFNGEPILPKVLSIKPNGHQAKAVCFLSTSRTDIKTVTIKNKFLLGVEGHSNIIKLDINNTFKDFRLHEKRKQITVNY